jgi:DNA-binding NtrC family response regulator
MELPLPPLRERGEDVLLLAETFVKEFAESYGKDVRGWDASTESWLLAYTWPGNVRELRETLRIGLLRARSCRIERGDLKVWIMDVDEGPADLRADTVMRHHLRRVLAIARGNLTRAGAMLGWERNKVRREAHRLGVPVRGDVPKLSPGEEPVEEAVEGIEDDGGCGARPPELQDENEAGAREGAD